MPKSPRRHRPTRPLSTHPRPRSCAAELTIQTRPKTCIARSTTPSPQTGTERPGRRSPLSSLRTLLSFIAVLCVGAIVLTACGSIASTEQPTEKPLVLTTFSVLEDMTKNVAGDHVQVRSIVPPGAEIHGYEPTPKDIAAASKASLVLDNGLHLERWFERFTEQIKVKHVTVSSTVEPIKISEDAAAGQPNPHAWMSPDAAVKYVQQIDKALSELDPDHAADFHANAQRYIGQITTVRDELRRDLDALPATSRALVTCEGAFSYLARDMHLTEHYIWPVNSENEATPQQLARTIAAVKKDKIPAVFCESTVSDDPMQQVVRETGARFGGILYVDSLSDPKGPVPTYLDLLRHDARTIVKGLSGK
ncbi:metal ABC transporter substrate-binding protein [Devriesea agamarum]|uniref:metal ABC transporter substrate-binding protein n=1 Tax=Devriesea agamarum TaxID=472569 RepID=UPI0009FD0108|nr:metal ABC transporter substrate-binding protein [Devriesea agamarum]